jgi:hypothetical protein
MQVHMPVLELLNKTYLYILCPARCLMLQSTNGEQIDAQHCNMASACLEQWKVGSLDVKQLLGSRLEGCTEQQLELRDTLWKLHESKVPCRLWEFGSFDRETAWMKTSLEAHLVPAGFGIKYPSGRE